jgi:phage terminase large subunit
MAIPTPTKTLRSKPLGEQTLADQPRSASRDGTLRGKQLGPGVGARPPYQPYGAARELMRCRDREVLLSGPSGTGKSMACLQKIDLAASQKPMRAAIVRKLRTALTQAALVTFREKVLPPPPNAIWFHHEDQEFRYPNGSRVVVAGLDDPRKVLSTDFDLIYVQEATELDEQDWLILLTRLRNNALSYQQLFADCNPSYPNHWLKLRADEGQISLLESRHEDNPQLFDHAAKSYTPFGLEYLKTLDSLTGYLHKRLRQGLWVAAEGMFYPEWSPEEHIVDLEGEELPRDWPRWISVDYGFAVPFCALWFARDPETREIWVYRELYGSGFRDEQQADLIKNRMAPDERILQIAMDPSMFNARTEQNRPSIAQVYASRGLGTRVTQGIFPAQNNRKQGWAIVRRALAHDEGTPRLRIVRGACPNLVRELPALVRDPLDPEDTLQTLRSKEVSDHAVDALRYGLCTEALPAPASAVRATFG